MHFPRKSAPSASVGSTGNTVLDAPTLIREVRFTFIRGLTWAGVLSGFINVLQLTVPLFMLQVHDRVINSQSLDTLSLLLVIALGAIILYGILDFIRAITFQAMAKSLLRRLNLPAISAAMSVALEKGSVQGTQVLRDLSDIRGFINGNTVAAPLEAMWAPIFLGVMFALHPYYGLAGTVAVIVLIGLSLLADLLVRRVTKEANDANLKNIGEIGATVSHAEAIEAMGMMPALAMRWRSAQQHASDVLDIGNARSKGMFSLSRSVRYAMQVGVLAMGAWLVIRGETTPGAMIGGTVIMGRLLLPFDNVTRDWRGWVAALSSWNRIRGILEERQSEREIEPTPRSEGALVVDNLVYAVPGSNVPVLKGISFELNPGEILGVVGPSAAGKSTLSRILVGAAKPTAGGVFLNGHNTYLWERGSFGDMVGYLPQSVSLLNGTIRDNIARMRAGDPRQVIEAARAAGVHEMIGRLPLGYDTPIGGSRHTLSGGQKQRIALARALYGWPRFLVLDEPNANLDAEGEASLIRAVNRAADDGAMVVLIAHRQSIMRFAHKLLVLQDGRIKQFGERTDVVRNIAESEADMKRLTDAGKMSGGAA
ncbi:type I secretion system permease/ATPase [Thalassospira sp.]|uniref:type I secretion system permease/ATPase n=1 Tax=Thalassospira sp. TaxID=1912094 RepID=UPI0027330D3C|nr:type I secretion system permease/ATPase [Thalassospira sp.]MDP2698139.1 type I secretion system permease/ATPase [Thalassospira sp.]